MHFEECYNVHICVDGILSTNFYSPCQHDMITHARIHCQPSMSRKRIQTVRCHRRPRIVIVKTLGTNVGGDPIVSLDSKENFVSLQYLRAGARSCLCATRSYRMLNLLPISVHFDP